MHSHKTNAVESTTKSPAWIGVDWGTSNVRAFAISDTGELISKKQSDRGMGTLKADEYETLLLSMVGEWLCNTITPVYICGMAGARQGWKEAQYLQIPCAPVDHLRLTPVTTFDKRMQVMILPGLCQPEPADVMRGEETQLAGLLHCHQERIDKENPDHGEAWDIGSGHTGATFTGTVCLPGTHSKWVVMNNGMVEKFNTFITGELFALLSQHSVLRHSVTGEAETQSMDSDAFLQAALKAVLDPVTTTGSLFGLRASSLLHSADTTSSRSTLSGLLIGQELAAARLFWENKPTTIIGAEEITSLYRSALTELGSSVTTVDATDATVAGLGLVASRNARDGNVKTATTHGSTVTMKSSLDPSK